MLTSYLESQPEDVILLHFQLLVQSEQLLKEVGQQRVAGALVVVVVGIGLLVDHLPLHRVVWGVRLCAAVLRFFKMRNFATVSDYKMTIKLCPRARFENEKRDILSSPLFHRVNLYHTGLVLNKDIAISFFSYLFLRAKFLSREIIPVARGPVIQS